MTTAAAEFTIEESDALREMIYEAQLESEARRERGEPFPGDAPAM